jgi:hypothetical protein
MVEPCHGAVLDKVMPLLAALKPSFVASQAGQEAVYLRALVRGFNFRQVGAIETWEDNASCIMMSENPANRERTRHVDTQCTIYGRHQVVEMCRAAECGRGSDPEESSAPSPC